jgi:hypothetical protein
VSEVDHASRAHAVVAPSSIKYVWECPSFIPTGGDNPQALEGTACHEATEVGDPHKAPEGCERLVEKALAYQAKLKEDNPNAEWRLEVRVYTHEPDVWGTVDVLGYDPEFRKVILCDWKFGFNYVDEARSNLQLATYAVGAVNSEYPDAKTVEVHLANPRRNEISDHTYNLVGIEKLKKQISEVVAKRNAEAGKTFHPYGDACLYCKLADGSCPVLNKTLLQPLVRPELALPDQLDPSSMTDEELARALDAEKTVGELVGKWSKKLKDEAHSRIDNGIEIPGGWVQKSRKGKFTVKDADDVQEIAANHGLSEKEIEGAVAVNVSALAEAVYTNAPDRQKKKQKTSFVNDLIANGAVTQARVSYLKREKKNEAIEVASSTPETQ